MLKTNLFKRVFKSWSWINCCHISNQNKSLNFYESKNLFNWIKFYKIILSHKKSGDWVREIRIENSSRSDSWYRAIRRSHKNLLAYMHTMYTSHCYYSTLIYLISTWSFYFSWNEMKCNHSLNNNQALFHCWYLSKSLEFYRRAGRRLILTSKVFHDVRSLEKSLYLL